MNRNVFLPLALISSVNTFATEPEATMSFQGYSGLINTPTATLFTEGDFYLQYGNQVETRDGYRNGDNYNFGLGLWEYVELSGRLADYQDPNGGQSPTDLSANIKLGIPFIPKNWFSLAVGIQDLGGAANLFDAKYVVASKNIFKNINVSLGLGQSDSNQGRLNGVFAGAAWQPYEWVKLSVENDAADTQAGMHLSTPKHWFNGIQLSTDVLISSTNDDLKDDIYYGVGLIIPLNINTTNKTSTYTSQKNSNRSPNNSVHDNKSNSTSEYTHSNELESNNKAPQGIKEREQVQKLLAKEGFEYISVGQIDSNTIYVELQDHTYNRNKLDGLGVALAIISNNIHYNYSDFKLVLKEREIPILTVRGNIIEYDGFLRDNKPLKIDISTDTFASNQAVSMKKSDNSNNFWLKPRFTFWPGITSAVGTELGAFDASFALVSHLELPLWRGAAITAIHTTQFAETTNFKEGNFFADDRQKTGLRNYSFHQTFSLPYSLKNMASVGKYSDTYNYLSNEIRWQSFNGSHKINLLTARYENQIIPKIQPFKGCNILFVGCWPDREPQERDVVVAKYKYYNATLNASAELQVGQYWQQDKGVVFKAERMFNDVTFTLTYKNTKMNNEEANQFVGLGFSVPLTPRKDFNNKYFQVRGNPKWQYSVSTLLGKEHNRLTPGTGDNTQQFYNLDSAFYNNDRLSREYIYGNAHLLKKAYYQTR